MLKQVVIFLLSAPLIYLAIAIVLVFTNPPANQGDLINAQPNTLDFSVTQKQDMSGLEELQSLVITGASPISFRFYPSITPTKRLIVLIHGSGWHSMQYAQMATWLANEGLGNVVTPDLRGHGVNPERRGDIDYIGQLEDDIAALITNLKNKHDITQTIIGGHSSGGGMVIRMAGGKHGKLADGWLLMAPFLKYNAPTMRLNSGGWAHTLVRRTVGLVMLNAVKITALNHLISIQFNMPKPVREGPLGHTATLAYSFRMNTSYAPRNDYEKDIGAITKPMLLLAGTNDEAFKAEAYQATFSAWTSTGEYKLLGGLGHLNLTHDPATFMAMKKWLLNFDER